MKSNHRIHQFITKTQCAVGFIILFSAVTGCKKFVEVDPPVSQITAVTAFSNNASAASVMTGMYSNITANDGFAEGATGISLLEGLSADELRNYSGTPIYSQFYTNTLSSSSGGSSNVYFWGSLYKEIHVANTVIEGLEISPGVSAPMKQQLVGEAKFMRAFLHFYLVNLYGDVPLVITSDYATNNSIKRSPKELVYKQIIQDLKDAQVALSDNFVDPSGVTTTKRVRPNKGAATALLARAYLYTKNWKDAETEATKVIDNTGSYTLLSDLNQVFLANSKEAIWQLAPVVPGDNTTDGENFVLDSPPGTGNLLVAMSDQLQNAFEATDARLTNWVGVYTGDDGTVYDFPYKYKMHVNDASQSVTEYLMVLRLAEQYLIRAEARAQLNNISGASADLNLIRARAGLGNTAAIDQASLLSAILHERQVELFTEWGHRWLDLKRTGQVNPVMGVITPLKGGAWNPDWALTPLPLSELKANPNLIQNPGY